MRLGGCDFLDVLEETVLMHVEATIELNDGSFFADKVVDVQTEGGNDYAVFERHPRIKVKDIAVITRQELPHTYPA